MTDGKHANFFAGFMSGLGHPIIGFDHFAFIVVGLAIKRQGILLPLLYCDSGCWELDPFNPYLTWS